MPHSRDQMTRPIRTMANSQQTRPIRLRPAAPTTRHPSPPSQHPAPSTRHRLPRPAPSTQHRLPRPATGTQHAFPLLALAALAVLGLTCTGITLLVGLFYADGVLPGVSAGGVPLGGLSQAQAADRLQAAFETITLQDGERRWQMPAAELGLTLAAADTAARAYDIGRGHFGAALPAILGQVEVDALLSVDQTVLTAALAQAAPQIDLPPVNAGVELVAGQVRATPPVMGRALDAAATAAALRFEGSALLLIMQSVAPVITDAAPMLEQARALLSRPLEFRLFDPVTGDSVYWSVPPTDWARWLTAQPDSTAPTGLALTVRHAEVSSFLSQQAAAVLDPSRFINIEEGTAAVSAAVAAGRSDPWLRVYHQPRQHTVQPGETITGIAWDYGVPYLYIVQANAGLEVVSTGQTITIPAADAFMPLPVNPDKRIVVSISQQRTTVYENGQLRWDWLASTGIPDSPTWPGLYQVISHEPNAYAGNWDLWMPSFMGVYQPIPGADFTNGFHGFPTRGGYQLLWTNSLGSRVTYGCILLSSDNARLLYDWAEEGVVVEIRA